MYRSKINSESKNEIMASVFHGCEQENVELITVTSFIEKTMKTLANYGEQLKIQLGFNLTQQENQLTLVKKDSRKKRSNLNKNLNFVPTQTNFNKTTLKKELEDFYRHIKIQTFF